MYLYIVGIRTGEMLYARFIVDDDHGTRRSLMHILSLGVKEHYNT